MSNKQVALEDFVPPYPVSLYVICSLQNFFWPNNTTQSSTIKQHPFRQRDLSLQQSNGFGPSPRYLRTPGMEEECLLLNCSAELLYGEKSLFYVIFSQLQAARQS